MMGHWDDNELEQGEAPDDIDPIFGTEDSTISVTGPPAGTQPPANMFDDEEDEVPIGETKKAGYIDVLLIVHQN